MYKYKNTLIPDSFPYMVTSRSLWNRNYERHATVQCMIYGNMRRLLINQISFKEFPLLKSRLNVKHIFSLRSTSFLHMKYLSKKAAVHLLVEVFVMILSYESHNFREKVVELRYDWFSQQRALCTLNWVTFDRSRNVTQDIRYFQIWSFPLKVCSTFHDNRTRPSEINIAPVIKQSSQVFLDQWSSRTIDQKFVMTNPPWSM